MEAKLKTSPNFNAYDTASIGISLNSRNHVGESLTAIVEWVNAQPTIRHCLVDLSDTLHRHNFIADGYSPEIAYKKARDLGDQWCTENEHILKKLNMPYKIIRWDDWLSKPEFLKNRIFFERAMTHDSVFRKAMHEDIENFLSRRGRQQSLKETEAIIDGCFHYLIEELAVHSIFFDQHPSISVYPGRQQKSFKMVRQGLIKNVPTGMQKSDYAGLYMHMESITPTRIAA